MDKKSDLLSLIESGLSEAKNVIDKYSGTEEAWKAQDAQNVISIFEGLRDDVVANRLPPSGGGGLGITRGLSEWQAPSNLYEAGKKIEEFYREEW